MLSDARTVFDYARQWLSTKGWAGPILVMGRSLGSASALEFAATRSGQMDGLVLDSGFADIDALLVRLGARLPDERPTDILLRQAAKIATHCGPTLIIHGTTDRIIPIEDAEAIFTASPSESKRLLRIPGAGHNDLLSIRFREYMSAISTLADQISRPDTRKNAQKAD